MQVSIIGDSRCTGELWELACCLGKELALRHIVVLTGGMSGVMEAASKGACQAGGTVVAILPSYDKSQANQYASIIIATGMGHARNIILVASGDAVVSVGGGSGTWSETAHALKLGKKVIALSPWHVIPGVVVAESINEVLTLL